MIVVVPCDDSVTCSILTTVSSLTWHPVYDVHPPANGCFINIIRDSKSTEGVSVSPPEASDDTPHFTAWYNQKLVKPRSKVLLVVKLRGLAIDLGDFDTRVASFERILYKSPVFRIYRRFCSRRRYNRVALLWTIKMHFGEDCYPNNAFTCGFNRKISKRPIWIWSISEETQAEEWQNIHGLPKL